MQKEKKKKSNGKYSGGDHTRELKKRNTNNRKDHHCTWTQSLAEALLLVALESQSPTVPIFLSPKNYLPHQDHYEDQIRLHK